MRWNPALWDPGSGLPESPPHRRHLKFGFLTARAHNGASTADAAQLIEMSTIIPPERMAQSCFGRSPQGPDGPLYRLNVATGKKFPTFGTICPPKGFVST